MTQPILQPNSISYIITSHLFVGISTVGWRSVVSRYSRHILLLSGNTGVTRALNKSSFQRRWRIAVWTSWLRWKVKIRFRRRSIGQARGHRKQEIIGKGFIGLWLRRKHYLLKWCLIHIHSNIQKHTLINVEIKRNMYTVKNRNYTHEQLHIHRINAISIMLLIYT